MADWQKPETLAIWLSIGVGTVLLLITAIILFTRFYIQRMLREEQERAQLKLDYQKDLLNDSVRVQERERNRIAADLHDGLISRLNVLMLTLHSPQHTPVAPSELLKESITIARRISHDLSPPLLNETDLVDLVNDFIIPLKSIFEIKVYFTQEVQPVINPETKLQLFRIVQEVISNIIKHARAKSIYIHMRLSEQRISISIQDDGIGFDADKPKGLGHKNIELRTQLLKGSCRFKSAPQQGTRFLMYLNNY